MPYLKVEKMIIKNILIVLLLVSCVDAKTDILKIDDIVEIALKNSPDIDIARLDFKSSKQRTKISKGFYLPRVDLNLDAGEGYTKISSEPSYNSNILIGSLGASQLLYDFGRTSSRIYSSTQEELALESKMQQSISDKIFFVKQMYYEILKSKNIILVQEKNVKLQKQQLNRAKKYLIAGIKTIIDVSDAQVNVEQSILDLQNAKYQLELKRAQLEEAIGVAPYDGKYTVYSPKLNMENLRDTLPKIDNSLHSLEYYAYEHRYALESSTYYLKSAKSNIKVLEADYYPTISLKGNYTAQDVDENIDTSTPTTQGSLSVNVQWNLFSGYQTDASVQEAKIGMLKASSSLNSIKLMIKREVLEAFIYIRQSRDNVNLTQSIAKSSLKKFEQAQKRYENELSDYVELQDAQQGYINSLSNLVNSYYDYFISLAQLDHSIGK
jgi:outer membrane protein